MVTMSFGNTELKNAMDINLQQLLDKNFQNDPSSNGKINIIGNVNYENINFNFTFSKNDFPIMENSTNILNNNNSPEGRKKSLKKKEKSPSHQQYSLTEIEKKEKPLNPSVTGYNNIDLRETPTFNLPMKNLKEQSEKSEKSIIKPPNLQSPDFLLQDLMEGFSFNDFFCILFDF